MKFFLLLKGLQWKLGTTAKKRPAFRERLREQDFTLQIKTRDDSEGRYYMFNDGDVFSRSGVHRHPDVALVWKTADLGFRLMKAGDRAALLKAREDGDLVVEGDPTLALWFTETVSQMNDPDAATQPPARREKVAFIGLGNMGAGIAWNLVHAGFQMTVHNRTEAKAKPFVDAGAILARTPKEAAAGSDIVITSLMGDDSVMSVVEGESGVLAGMKPGAIHVGASTVSPECATRLAQMHTQHGSRYLSAPVLGRPDVAEAGELVTFVAGDAEAIAQVEPVLEAYTRMVIKMPGDQRLANIAKLCANYTAVSAIDLMGQLYAFADKSGVDLAILETLFQSTWAHPGLKEYATKIRARKFESEGGFAMTGGLKDVELMLSASEAEGAALDFAPIIQRKMLAAIDQDMSDLDWSGIYEVTRRRAGLS
jgi:3-hydroxyisobutyrate dehydrogenase-like beta-hydroxyacid dehydrogenase